MKHGPIPPGWIVPHWPAPPWVRAVVSTREGGVSSGLFESMNLADHVGDVAADVVSNRDRLGSCLQARPVFLRQVHGWQVQQLEASTPDGVQADGAVSVRPALACTVMVADCLPILLTHDRVPVVAALHAGWRGLAGRRGEDGEGGGIVESGWSQLQAATGLSAGELSSGLMAWLGPCIGPGAFEVGVEVREAFVQHQPSCGACFVPLAGGKFLADLPQLARLRLQRLGIHRIHGNDGSRNWCTVAQSGFFSHRRVASRAGARPGDTGGRMAACIWLGD